MLASLMQQLPFQDELQVFQKKGFRFLLGQILNIVLVVTTALFIWKTQSVVLDTSMPIVVVLSGSMEPGIHRGDLLFLSNPSGPLKTGDIVVYEVKWNAIPIVHRVVESHTITYKDEDNEQKRKELILTKGDNNQQNDLALYNGLAHLDRSDVVGVVKYYVPYVGYSTILMSDYPRLKYLLFAIFGVTVLFQREE